jgi:MFS transporter, DHA1 family, multidrug resistance protein
MNPPDSALPQLPATGTVRGTGTIVLLAAIAVLGSLATQLLVPALPQLAQDLSASIGDAQLVISVFLAGLGASQLVVGPLADRFGRKPVLLLGLAIYCCGSLLAATATSLPVLLAARLAQALGGAAGIVSARVLVSDLFPPEEHVRRQATLMGVVMVSPAFGPVIGGLMSEQFGWRSIFATLAVGGVLGAILAATALPVPPAAAAGRQRPSLIAGLSRMIKEPRFVGSVTSTAAATSALYMMLGTAPFLLTHDFGLDPSDVGGVLLGIAVASFCGTMAVAPVVRRGGDAQVVGTAVIVVGCVTLLGTTLWGGGGLAGLVAPVIVAGFGTGISGPAGTARVIRAAPGFESTAVSIAGATQMLTAAACATLFSRFEPITAVKIGTALTVASVIAMAGALVAARADRRSP